MESGGNGALKNMQELHRKERVNTIPVIPSFPEAKDHFYGQKVELK